MELNQDLIDAIGKRIEWYKNLRPEQKLLGDRGFAGSIAQDDLAKLYDLIQLVIQERDDLQAELASLREIARTLKDAAWRGDDQLWPIVPNRIENLISDHESKWGKVEKERLASLVGLDPVICEGCGGEVNPDYGRCRECG